MGDRKNPLAKQDRLPSLERQVQEAKDKEAAAEDRADETVEQAEQLEEKSRELGEARVEIRKKAAEPIGLPPPPKGKRTPK